MRHSKTMLPFLILCLASSGVFAAGVGKGRTQSIFRADFVTLAKNRILLKLDVSQAMAGVPTNTTGTRNDDVGGLNVSVTLNGTEFTETFASNGRVNTATFKARLVANGQILMIDLRGLDLPTILGLDSTAAGKNLNVSLDVLVSVSSPEDPDTGEVPSDGVQADLFDGGYDYKYSQKADRFAQGRGFPSNGP
ncbi:MAG: hypothetical protein HS116_23940 [Planctomycetes bacterium]|nr:hypothetical protein [Planctomycetota bacterium]